VSLGVKHTGIAIMALLSFILLFIRLEVDFIKVGHSA
jgi:hypothetical protein